MSSLNSIKILFGQIWVLQKFSLLLYLLTDITRIDVAAAFLWYFYWKPMKGLRKFYNNVIKHWMSYCNIGYDTMCIWPLFSYNPPLLCELVLAAIKIFSSKKFNYMNHRLRSIWQNLSSPNLDKIFFCNLSFKYHQTKNRYL